MMYKTAINLIRTTTFIIVVLLVLYLASCSQMKEPARDTIIEAIQFVGGYNQDEY